MESGLIYNEALLRAKALGILRRLDEPRRKSERPVKPALGELFGMAKAGKDRQLVRLDRWFRQSKFRVLVHQESAEADDIRKRPKDHTLSSQMQHFVYSFDRLLKGAVNRDYHMMLANRGILDTLVWLEKDRRDGAISGHLFKVLKAFIMQTDWLKEFDFIECLTVTPEVALDREFGPAWREGKVIFGSKMNPTFLASYRDCVMHICETLTREIPHLSLNIIDTSSEPEEETEHKLVAHMIESLERRLALSEDEVLPWSIDLMKERACVTGPEIKLRGARTHEELRKCGWRFEGAVSEHDTYLTPKNRRFLEDNECFVMSSCGEKQHYFIYKKESFSTRFRPKIPIPISRECMSELLSEFTPVYIIEKSRELFSRDGFIMHRDSVNKLGEFTEIKGYTRTTEDELMTVITELGFTDDAIVPESYIRLAMNAQLFIA